MRFLGSILPVLMLSIFGRVLSMRSEGSAAVGVEKLVRVGAEDGQERTEDLNLTVHLVDFGYFEYWSSS